VPQSKTGSELDRIFNPKSVVVIGASDKPGKHGNQIVKNLKEFGFEGIIYPVNPNINAVEAIRTYRSVLDIDTKPDLAIIVIPASGVPHVLGQCAKKEIKGAVIISGGFSEAGESGKDLQEQCLRIANSSGMRIIGPNCAGLFSAESKLHASIATQQPLPGSDLAIISQSGSLRRVLLMKTKDALLGVSTYVNVGNQLDLDLCDFLEYFGNDDKCSSLVVLIEGLKDGRRFIETASEVTRKKPVIALAVGVSEPGRRTSKSHTSTMISSLEVYRSAFQKAGVIEVESLDQVCDVLAFALAAGRFMGHRIALICPGGGLAIHATDIFQSRGIVLPKLSDNTAREIEKSLTEVVTIKTNPIDLGAVSKDMFLDSYKRCLSALSDDSTIDGICAITLSDFYFPRKFADLTVEFSNTKKKKKPIMVIWIGEGEGVASAKEGLRRNRVPIFNSLNSAADGLAKFLRLR